MLDWIAQDAETNRRIDFAQGLQIGERVNLFACRAFLFHVEGHAPSCPNNRTRRSASLQ